VDLGINASNLFISNFISFRGYGTRFTEMQLSAHAPVVNGFFLPANSSSTLIIQYTPQDFIFLPAPCCSYASAGIIAA
jgi:hypothetical protein